MHEYEGLTLGSWETWLCGDNDDCCPC